ncbi:hypothetical protein [Gilvibacter sp.]|jgi:hypothetical protein|uniref:hypothetical protein n=1 Tax=Gilvibacter sp. TaxID=2729997 RepID=UPI003B52693C
MRPFSFLVIGLALSSIISCTDANKKNSSDTEQVTVIDTAAVAQVNYIPIDSDEALIQTALLAAPEAGRAGAKVIGYNAAGEFVTFREGTNEFIVLVDDSSRKGFNAACYHKDLEPFMARGRALRAEGKSADEIFAIREAEAKAGTLPIPTGATLHIYFGPSTNYDPESGAVEKAKLRYVVYMPFATAESTGLPESPVAANHPWIMNPGTHRAHIMISPINGDQ